MCILGGIRTRFVLVHTDHPGNVGSAARAIKTMGFDELALVAPKDPKVLNRKKTRHGASGALNVLDGARVFDSLPDALEGIDVWCATGMPTDMSRERKNQRYHEPRVYFQDLLTNKRLDNNNNRKEQENEEQNEDLIKSVAFVFGCERLGLSDEDMELCHLVLGIPTNPDFGSLNLASAVQLIAYDWRQALGGFPTV